MEADAASPFLADIFPIMQQAKQVVITLALCAARVMGLVQLMPVFKRTELGRALLTAIAMGLALPIYGGLSPVINALPIDITWFLVLLMLKEFCIGLLLGLFFGIPFWAIQAMGEFVDHQRAIGESGIQDANTGSQSSVMSALLGTVAITLFVVQGGLSIMMDTIYQSYQIWEIGLFFPEITIGALHQVTSILGQVVLFGLLIAAPLIFLFLLSDFATMALGRTTGRINVSSMLPLVKNVLFGGFSLLYLQFLMGYLQEGLGQISAVSQMLKVIVGK